MVLGIFKIALRFCVAITGNFERFEYFSFITNFLENEPFSKKLKAPRLKTHHFHAKLPCQKPMLRQIEWGVQIGPMYLIFLILFKFKNLL